MELLGVEREVGYDVKEQIGRYGDEREHIPSAAIVPIAPPYGSDHDMVPICGYGEARGSRKTLIFHFVPNGDPDCDRFLSGVPEEGSEDMTVTQLMTLVHDLPSAQHKTK